MGRNKHNIISASISKERDFTPIPRPPFKLKCSIPMFEAGQEVQSIRETQIRDVLQAVRSQNFTNKPRNLRKTCDKQCL